MELRLFVFSFLFCMILLFTANSGKREDVQLLILMYHHIDDLDDGEVTVSADSFELHLSLLSEQGFEFVSFDDVISFVDGKTELPPKPVCIVFDDGYESNYSLAFPALRRHNAKATFCVIGSAVGHRCYKDTDFTVIPHFSWRQAREMTDSGLASIGSHTYDMHMYPPYESGAVREYATALPFESDASFESAFRLDCQRMSELMREHLGYAPTVFAYPHGKWDADAERVLKEFGYRVTLITEAGYNTVKRGDTDCLYLLKRYNINEHSDISAIIAELPLS